MSSVETVPTILLAGTSGSGKSTVAHALARRVPMSSLVLSLDKYERLGAECRVEPDGYINWENPDSRDFDKLSRDIRDLQSGKEARIPTELTFRDTSPGDCLHVAYSAMEAPELLVVEGHLLLGSPRIRSLGTLAVFLDSSDSDERLARRQHASRDPYYETKYFTPGEATRVLPTSSYADAVVDTAHKSVEAVTDELLALAGLDLHSHSLDSVAH